MFATLCICKPATKTVALFTQLCVYYVLKNRSKILKNTFTTTLINPYVSIITKR